MQFASHTVLEAVHTGVRHSLVAAVRSSTDRRCDALTLQWRQDHMAANFDMRKGRVQVEWFRGAKTNVCYNALDRWVAAGRGQQVTPRTLFPVPPTAAMPNQCMRDRLTRMPLESGRLSSPQP